MLSTNIDTRTFEGMRINIAALLMPYGVNCWFQCLRSAAHEVAAAAAAASFADEN